MYLCLAALIHGCLGVQDAVAAGDDSTAQRPKKQRQPQRRRPAAQPCGGPAAAAEALPADGLDPQLVARLAAQRQQKFGCCGGQKGVARTSSGASPPADKDKPESQPQQQRPSQQQRSLLASVSLQVRIPKCSLPYTALVLLLAHLHRLHELIAQKRKPLPIATRPWSCTSPVASMCSCARARASLHATAAAWHPAGSGPVCGAGFHAPPKAAAHKGSSSTQTADCQKWFSLCRQFAVLWLAGRYMCCAASLRHRRVYHSLSALQIAVF